MIGKLFSALVGSAIDRQDGKGGFKGAMLGYAAGSILRRLGPIGWVVGGMLALGKLIFGGSKKAKRGSGGRKPSVRHLGS
jgi:hypothetical protein